MKWEILTFFIDKVRNSQHLTEKFPNMQLIKWEILTFFIDKVRNSQHLIEKFPNIQLTKWEILTFFIDKVRKGGGAAAAFVVGLEGTAAVVVGLEGAAAVVVGVCQRLGWWWWIFSRSSSSLLDSWLGGFCKNYLSSVELQLRFDCLRFIFYSENIDLMQ